MDFPVRYLFAPLLALGYLALIARLVEKFQTLWLWSRLEQVGKMSLSCYVLQNITASIIFYGWGLGLGGQVDAATTVLLWLTISCVQVAFAALWLKWFALGPMESARRYMVNLAGKR